MKFPKSCKVIMYFNRFFEITQFQSESQKSFLWLNFLMSHKRLVFTWQKNFQEVIHPQIFFVIYLYLDASAKRIFKQKNSLADLMHSHISKSDHSGGVAKFLFIGKNCLQSGVSKKSKILSSYKMDGPSIFRLQIFLWSIILCQSIQINCKRHLVLKYSTFILAEILQDFSILTQTGQKLNISTLNKCCIQLPT